MDMRVELILAAAIVNMFVGAVWYSTALFGRLWQGLVKKNERELQRRMGTSYRTAMIVALIMAYVLARLLGAQEDTSLATNLNTVFWIWAGLLMPALTVSNTFAQRPWLLSIIDGSYHLFAMLAMTLVLSV
jgi:hypothetical protein